jgi:hypothetical protein
MVDVTISEARGRNFSIFGNAGRPGQYLITDREFRLLDALITAQATQQEITSIQIIRPTRTEPGKAPEQPRIIEVDPKALLAGDVRQNPIVRPGDRIVVKAAQDAGRRPRIDDPNNEEKDEFLLGLLRDASALRTQIGMEMTAGAGAENPKVVRLRETLKLLDVEIQKRRTELRIARGLEQAATGGEYTLRGDVPRDGSHAIVKDLKLGQALKKAGLDAAQHGKHRVHMLRRSANRVESVLFRDIPLSQCLEGVLGEIEIAPGDVISVTKAPTLP